MKAFLLRMFLGISLIFMLSGCLLSDILRIPPAPLPEPVGKMDVVFSNAAGLQVPYLLDAISGGVVVSKRPQFQTIFYVKQDTRVVAVSLPQNPLQDNQSCDLSVRTLCFVSVYDNFTEFWSISGTVIATLADGQLALNGRAKVQLDKGTATFDIAINATLPFQP